MTIQNNVRYLSPEEGLKLWEHDYRFTVHETGKEAYRDFNIDTPEYQHYMNWDPTFFTTKRNLSLIQKHVHPAKIENGRLYSVCEKTITLSRAFTINPKLDDEILDPFLVGHFITIHTCSDLYFKASLHEVYNQ